MENWTIEKLISWMVSYFTEKQIDSPRLSAELLLCHVLQSKRIELYMHFQKEVQKPQLDQLRQLVKRAAANEPIAYLVGKTEFYSLEIQVCKDCLIPRPETELLVERAIGFLRSRAPNQLSCDLCTGSGCIAVAIAKNVSDSRIIATDISDAALNIAEKNVQAHQLQTRVKLLCGALFDPLLPQLDIEKFDLITCNPPYITSDEFLTLDKNVRDYEPKQALHGGADGLDVYRRIFEKVDSFLKPDGCLMLEIGYSQGQAIRGILEAMNCFAQVTIEKDFSNNDRVVIARKL
jgi:release factor glutamine methyltransferase